MVDLLTSKCYGVGEIVGSAVFVGRGVSVYGSGVSVSGSVGISVGVSKMGMRVTPGVIVGLFGTHNRSPA